MKNKLLQLFTLVLTIVSGFVYAGPPTPGGGGTSGDADQVLDETPIDMYMLPMVILAVVFIVMYAAKIIRAQSVK